MDLQFPAIDDDFPVIVPPLSNLVTNLAECEQNGLPLNCAEGDLRTCDVVLSAFFACFKRSLDDYDYDENEAELIAVGFGIFERLGQIFTVTYRSVQNNEHDLTVLNIIAIIESLRQLEDILRQQREYRYEKPKLSKASGLDDILRAGQAVLEGRRDWGFLSQRLERLRPAAEALFRNQYNPPYVEEHCAALQQMFVVCANGDIDALPQAMHNLKVTGEAFLDVSTNGVEGTAAPKFSCPFCGAGVGQWDKKCPSCNSKMPDRSYEKDVVPSEAFELPGYLKKVTTTAERMRHGEESYEAFYASVQQVIDNVSYIGTRLDGMTVCNSDSTPEERQIAQNVTNMLAENGSNFARALQYFDALSDPLDEDMLDTGLEIFVAALDGVRQATLEARKLERLRGVASDY